jgi:alpha-L-rhamnosidase
MIRRRRDAWWKAGTAGLLLSALWLASPGSARGAGELERGFARPPASARPWVYWFWLNGNITREGITADLEAMKRVGVGGVLIMEVDQGAPVGPVDFAGPKWRELFKHVCSEASRLGLEVNMNNDAGWNGSGGPWVTPAQSMQKVVWSETAAKGHFEGTLAKPEAVAGHYRDIAVLAVPADAGPKPYRIENIQGKASFVAQGIPPRAEYPAAPAGAAIPRDKIVDLSAKMDASGKLACDLPAGNWTIIRLGHTSTGAVNAPSPATGRGLEADKLDRDAVEAHYKALIGNLVKDNAKLAGKSLVATHIDSWEIGAQNWTPKFREEFKRLRGYDIAPFLPVYTGRVVDSLEVSERFLWDLRQTVNDLLLKNYAEWFRELARRDGLRLTIEAYGNTTVVDMDYAARADEPMAEFWSWSKFGAAETCREMASAAHVYGKPILGAEAFTATDAEKWQGHPGNIKDLGDWAFTEGINRFVFHRYALQPWQDAKPGMSMGPWGLHYERSQTWWEQSGAWHEYLARCQYLLQQGRFVADILYLQPEGAPQGFGPPRTERSPYNFDGCTAEAVMTRMSVKDGRIVLPDGMSYRVLSLPGTPTMTPALLRKIKELADAGATVVGPRPVKSPSLSGYPACDAEVGALTEALWGGGKVIVGRTAEQVLESKGVKPDFLSEPRLRFIHKQLGDTELYFVANGRPQAVDGTASFRVTGRRPELWWPDTGRVELAPVYEEKDGMTKLALRLDPSGSVFVIFPPGPKPADAVVSVSRDGQTIIPPPVPTGTIVVTKAVYGVPGDAKRTRDVKARVQRLVDAGEMRFNVARMADGDDPAFMVVKTIVVDYTVNGQSFSATGQDPQEIELALPPAPDRAAAVVVGADGRVSLLARKPGRYELKTASGATKSVAVAKVAPAVGVRGPWDLSFAPGAATPASITLDRLVSWSELNDPAAKGYSGTATYRTTFDVPPDLVTESRRFTLDLGQVEVMASVTLNGKELGTLWKAPYQVDVTGLVRPGTNLLGVHVVNLWINRQIADEALPDDSARNPDGTLKAWPDWVKVRGKSISPTGRQSFTSWRLWKKTDKLVTSGLLGPVRLAVEEVAPVP